MVPMEGTFANGLGRLIIFGWSKAVFEKWQLKLYLTTDVGYLILYDSRVRFLDLLWLFHDQTRRETINVLLIIVEFISRTPLIVDLS